MTTFLMGGSALAVNWADQNVTAILEAWYPGGQGDAAVADVLAGNHNFSGRLPVTFYKSLDELPAFEDYSMAKRTYRYYQGEPLYSFGYGLSDTQFTYKNARVDHENVPAEGMVALTAEVTNTGDIAGELRDLPRYQTKMRDYRVFVPCRRQRIRLHENR
jgi:beta-glucosidase